MPDSALKNYFAEAQQEKAILVLQGLKNSSFLEIRDQATKLGMNFNIDPNLFEQYHYYYCTGNNTG